MYRRRFIAAAAVPTSIVAAGCLGGADGEDGVYEFDADPATIGSGALADAGYEGEEPEPFEIETEFEEFGIDAAVSVTTWSVVYANPIREAALFVTSTPDARVAGQSVNPLVRADNAEVLRRLLERAGDDADVDAEEFEERGSETRRILDANVEVHTFETELEADLDLADVDVDADDGDVDDADVDDGDTDDGDVDDAETDDDVPVLIHLVTVEHDDDVVAVAGVHPAMVDERETLLSLMEATEH